MGEAAQDVGGRREAGAARKDGGSQGGLMAEERVEKIKVVQRHGIIGGGLWFTSWLFTIGCYMAS